MGRTKPAQQKILHKTHGHFHSYNTCTEYFIMYLQMYFCPIINLVHGLPVVLSCKWHTICRYQYWWEWELFNNRLTLLEIYICIGVCLQTNVKTYLSFQLICKSLSPKVVIHSKDAISSEYKKNMEEIKKMSTLMRKRSYKIIKLHTLGHM